MQQHCNNIAVVCVDLVTPQLPRLDLRVCVGRGGGEKQTGVCGWVAAAVVVMVNLLLVSCCMSPLCVDDQADGVPL